MPEPGAPPSAPAREASTRTRRPSGHRQDVDVPWGALDLAVAAALEGKIVRACEHHPARLMVDLGRVEFMDASGLHALERARDRLRAQGTRMSLRSVGPQPRRLLELVAMSEEFDAEAV